MNNKIIITCLDGAFGFRGIIQRLKQRKYQSDIVKQVIDELIKDYKLDRSIFKFKTARGSAVYVLGMKRFIQKYSNPDNRLLLIGKSKGAYWINEIAKDIENKKWNKYSKKIIITVDTCWLGRNNNNLIPPKDYDKLYNYYQLNEQFLNGAFWSYKDIPRDQIDKKYFQRELIQSNHWDIIEFPQVIKAIKESILSLLDIKVDDKSLPDPRIINYYNSYLRGYK